MWLQKRSSRYALNLKTANQSFCMTLWPLIMHHCSKFGYKRFSSWGDIIHWSRWTFTRILNRYCDLDIDHNRAIQSIHKTIQLSCKRISSSEDILERHILIIWSFTVTLTLRAANQSFGKTIWRIMMHHHTKFSSKRFSNSEDIFWTNIHWHFEVLLWPWPSTQQSNFFIRHSDLW